VPSGPRPTLQMLFGRRGPASDPEQVHAAAARGTTTAATQLPHLAQIQKSFGKHDISGVQAHVGAEAAASAQEMGATAYATGNHVVLGAGTDLHTVAHEAAHVVQQRAGVHLKGGVGEVGDPYERQADEVADAVVRGESAEGLLDDAMGCAIPPASAAHQTGLAHVSGKGGAQVQRAVQIDGVHYVKDRKNATRQKQLFSSSEHYQGDGDKELTIIDALLQSPTQFQYSSENWRAEIKMRKALIKGMQKLTKQRYKYNWDSDDLELPGTWQSVDYTSEGSQKDLPKAAFIPNVNVSPDDAIDDLFAQSGSGPTYFLDCSSAIVAIQYRALLAACRDAAQATPETYDDQEFNSKYHNVVIHAEGVTGTKPNGTFVPSPVSDLTQEVTVDSADKLIPGDLVYFVNYADYDQTHNGPEAAWAGEHAIYYGNDQFQGFGIEKSSSMTEMIDQLKSAYNSQALNTGAKRKEDFEHASDTLNGKRPGLSKKVRRMKSPLA